MKTLLLCGYRAKDQDEALYGELIDRRIEELEALNYEVICVLAGPDSDDILRNSKRIHAVEIVYDTNDQPNLLSNTRAGVHAAPGEAVFILPLEIQPPAKKLWDFLKNEHGKLGFATEHTFLHALEAQGAPYHYGFPLLLTVKGSKRLEKSSAFAGFSDARLNSRALPFI